MIDRKAWIAGLVIWCACLGGSRPSYDYFVLTTTHHTAAMPRVKEPPTVGINDVTIPGYLDRESIATRTDEQRLTYSSRDRWAEPLQQAFERTLRQELAAKLAPAGIAVPARTATPTYQVHVDVLRFERRGADQVELWARWTLRTDAELLYSGETRVQLPITATSEAAAAALSRTVAQLAGEIGDHVRIAARSIAAAAPHAD